MKLSERPKVVVVAGPTASGKSDMAMELARRFNGEIISADSRQVYRGMDIGTGKVRRDKGVANSEQGLKTDYYTEGIRHWMIDVADPKRQYSVVKWRVGAGRAITDIARRGKLPIVCGGTGFWIDTLVYCLSLPSVKPNAKMRATLQKLTTAQLFARLSKLDPTRAATIDRHNPVRLIRALEIVLTTGHPVPERNKRLPAGRQGSRYEPFYLVISIPQDELHRRIGKRLDSRLKAGMISEVRRLHNGGVSWKRLESFGLEYRWVAHFLQGTISRQQMRDGLLRDIIAYSRRQLTWWRANPDCVPILNATDARRLTEKFLKSS